MSTAALDRGRIALTPEIGKASPPPVSPSRAPSGGAQPLFPLGLLGAGEQAHIASVRTDPASAGDCRTEELGLRVGRTVEMLTNGGGGPLLLKVDESRLAIDRRVAMKILVRRQR